MNHTFDVSVAKRYGVEAAIMLENFRFWIAKNKANGRHFYDGRYWTYNSIKAFSELFPYWSAPQIRRILDKLESAGVLVSGSFNSSPWDKTKWYAFSDKTDLLEQASPFAEIGKSQDTDINTDTTPVGPQGGTRCPYDQIVKAYTEELPSLPGVRVMDDKRKRAIKRRWEWVLSSTKSDGSRRAETPEAAIRWFHGFFARVRDNEWLMGTRPARGHENWTADLDYLMTDRGLKSVLERTKGQG